MLQQLRKNIGSQWKLVLQQLRKNLGVSESNAIKFSEFRHLSQHGAQARKAVFWMLSVISGWRINLKTMVVDQERDRETLWHYCRHLKHPYNVGYHWWLQGKFWFWILVSNKINLQDLLKLVPITTGLFENDDSAPATFCRRKIFVSGRSGFKSRWGRSSFFGL